jgi:hypothetical protein
LTNRQIEDRGMRLTLRTLLAWLDDTLEPTQVKEIGKQVAESPFAQELSDRIHRVARQRRLSVPNSSGPDATDPNVVAGYLDNELDPEAVADFEKKCLTSDVNLAEVASVHQILSLLGQKVKVPPEARARMYQLVKGRETIRSSGSVAKRSPPPEPVTKPIQPWVVPEAPKRSWIERFGPAVACILLIMLSSWSAWTSLTGPSDESSRPTPEITRMAKDASIARAPVETAAGGSNVAKEGAPAREAAPEPGQLAAIGTAAKGQQPPLAQSAGAERPSHSADVAPADNSKVAGTSALATKSKEDAPLPTVPDGSTGLAEKADGILLRYDDEKREWGRLTDATPLNRSDHLLCLAPGRTSITMGKMRIMLVGETEVRILSLPTDPVPALELVQGRLLVRQPASKTLKVVFSNRPAELELSLESSLALERVDRRPYGQPVTEGPPLTIYCIQGEVSIAVDPEPETLKPSSVATVDSAGRVKQTMVDSLPTWASEAELSSQELQVRDQFLRVFHAGRPVLAEIVAAIDEDRPEIKRLAISALKALGDLSLLMPMLARGGDPIARRSTIEAIRAYMGLGPDAKGRVREQLDEEFGARLGSVVEKMLIGYSTEEASNRDIYQRLVGLLSPEQESVGVRELALDTLKRLTGRGDLGYDPDKPSGRGYDAWKDLLQRGDLHPLTPRPKTN